MPTANYDEALDALSADERRKRSIVGVSAVGIVANVALAGFKAVVGLLTGSIAIVLDAVNNLSDAASSLITIVGTKLAGKQADHDHPFGHGRAEYLTTIVVAAVVLWAGITSLVESVRGIVHPEAASYDAVSLAIVAVAVVAKVALGRYFRAAGERLHADALTASGEDATMDAVISASTLVAAGIYLSLGWSLEAWLGAAISLVIVKSGVDILREALSKVLGERVDSEVAVAVKEAVCAVQGVRGAYDLNLTDYGPQRLQGSVHVEVDERMSARDIDKLTREVQLRVLRDTGVLVHTVGIYSANADDKGESAEIRAALEELVAQDPYALQVHGLYVDEALRGANFDLVVSFEAPDRRAVVDQFVAEMGERFPGFAFVAVLDSDLSD